MAHETGNAQMAGDRVPRSGTTIRKRITASLSTAPCHVMPCHPFPTQHSTCGGEAEVQGEQAQSCRLAVCALTSETHWCGLCLMAHFMNSARHLEAKPRSPASASAIASPMASSNVVASGAILRAEG